ncbi:outer membrane esterase [Salmonella enterica subsp. enterica]|uniref:Outer membrane esterase n=1 Tax=Salmonella enterica I TaxID=59201 RepID=A0A379UM79_SALET|nr:outer membrane esterase [Salmonella enterica subsp. enterica]
MEEGETNGRLWGARLTSGYDFVMVPWLTTGPMLQYAWDYSHVNGYSEKLTTSTSMRFGDQNAHSQVGSAGWRLDLRHSIIHSWAQINYRRQFGDDTYVANGGLKSTALTFSRDGKTQDKKTGLISRLAQIFRCRQRYPLRRAVANGRVKRWQSNPL